ncbi:MAG: hypothetical protein PHC60_01520 [Heliobacteriaceae bacterium]|nr:hypothetical protein [Heliobacteriaceae bacterium]MDD4587055.1 hypothetical protein [Heliobacteriaceae bacterium]
MSAQNICPLAFPGEICNFAKSTNGRCSFIRGPFFERFCPIAALEMEAQGMIAPYAAQRLNKVRLQCDPDASSGDISTSYLLTEDDIRRQVPLERRQYIGSRKGLLRILRTLVREANAVSEMAEKRGYRGKAQGLKKQVDLIERNLAPSENLPLPG